MELLGWHGSRVTVGHGCFVSVWFYLLLTQLFFFAFFAAVQSLNSLNDQIAQFMVTRPCSLADEDEAFIPGERDTLRKSMTLMRHLLVDAQVQSLPSAQKHFYIETNNVQSRGQRVMQLG